MAIDVEKLKTDVAAAADSTAAADVGIQAARAEAVALRLSHGGGGQQAMDELIRDLDAAAAGLKVPPA